MKFPHIFSIILLATIAISSCSIVNAFGSQVHMTALPTATCSNAQLTSPCSGGTDGGCHALVNALQNSAENPLTFIFLLILAIVSFLIPRLKPQIQALLYRFTEINISPPQMLLADGLVALRI